jgi:hypothetical protein
MPGTNVVRRALLPLQSVRLGRIVRNIEKPHDDYLDVGDLVSADSIIFSTKSKYQQMEKREAESSFAGTLASLFSASYSKQDGSSTQVTAEKVTTYVLPNSTPYFRDIIQKDSARQWVKNSMEAGVDMYMITGFHTYLNARIIKGAATTADLAGQVRGPVTEALIKAGIIQAANGTGDAAVDGTNLRVAGDRVEYVAAGEQICAIEYRQVYFPKDVDQSSLGEENTINFGPVDIRGTIAAADEIVAIDLRDELEFDPDEVDGAYEELKTAEGIFLY